jgi:hypothetical protein
MQVETTFPVFGSTLKQKEFLKWNATETGTIRRHYLSRKGY